MVATQMVYIVFVHLFYYLSFINSNIYSSFSLSLVVLQQGFLSGFNRELLTVFLTNDLHCRNLTLQQDFFHGRYFDFLFILTQVRFKENTGWIFIRPSLIIQACLTKKVPTLQQGWNPWSCMNTLQGYTIKLFYAMGINT